MSKKREDQKNYHHGDLVPALIGAGLTLLRERGIDAVTLRNVASAASVSHSAPYHYFPTKAALLAAMAASGFDSMNATIELVASELDACEPIAQLRAVGRGYLAFARANPELFRLMFRPELICPNDHPLLKAAEQRTFGALFAAMQAYIATRKAGPSPVDIDARVASGFAWSTVHGLATLHLDQVFGETPVGQLEFESFANQAVEFVIIALEANGSS
ncbi:MAG: TetR-like C-terminal domain-containing protein [Pirellula sp.]